MLCNICRKYIREKQTTQILLGNIEILKHSLAEHQRCLEQKHAQFMQLKEHATERLNQYTQLKYYHYNHQWKKIFFFNSRMKLSLTFSANVQFALMEDKFAMENADLRNALNEVHSKYQSLLKDFQIDPDV